MIRNGGCCIVDRNIKCATACGTIRRGQLITIAGFLNDRDLSYIINTEFVPQPVAQI